jgi:hypothetical protein
LCSSGTRRAEPLAFFEQRRGSRRADDTHVFRDARADRTRPGRERVVIGGGCSRIERIETGQRAGLLVGERREDDDGQTAVVAGFTIAAERGRNCEMGGHPVHRPPRVGKTAGRFAERKGAEREGRRFVRLRAAHVRGESARHRGARRDQRAGAEIEQLAVNRQISAGCHTRRANRLAERLAGERAKARRRPHILA